MPFRLEKAKEGDTGTTDKENIDLEEVCLRIRPKSKQKLPFSLLQIMTAREEELKNVWESRIEELVRCSRS